MSKHREIEKNEKHIVIGILIGVFLGIGVGICIIDDLERLMMV